MTGVILRKVDVSNAACKWIDDDVIEVPVPGIEVGDTLVSGRRVMVVTGVVAKGTYAVEHIAVNGNGNS